MKELHFTKKDFKIEWFSGSGPGGQNRNKRQNCCRIIHIETGIKAQGTEQRDRASNQRTAFKRLTDRLIEHYIPDVHRKRIASDEVIRTYHGVRNEVLDKASGLKQSYREVVEKGDISQMVDARRMSKLGVDDEDCQCD